MSGHRPVAPCGTKTARNRHRRRGETCEACKPAPRPVQPCGTAASYKRGCRCEPCTTAHREDQRTKAAAKAELKPCGTHAARMRHHRKGETCKTCTPRELSPCGTLNAWRRHQRKNETCTTCETVRPKPRPAQPCGTPAAYQRHKKRGEETCDPCIIAYRADQADRKRKTTQPRNTLTTDELAQEIRFLLQCGEGEHRILAAVGYAGRWKTLRGRLVHAGHADLADRVFTPWDLAA